MDLVALFKQQHEFFEDATGSVGTLTLDGDLVATNVDHRSRVLVAYQVQEFIVLAEQRDHEVVAGNPDDGGAARHSTPGDRTLRRPGHSVRRLSEPQCL